MQFFSGTKEITFCRLLNFEHVEQSENSMGRQGLITSSNHEFIYQTFIPSGFKNFRVRDGCPESGFKEYRPKLVLAEIGPPLQPANEAQGSLI